MMYGWDGWGWGGWILMTLMMIIFWAVVIAGVVLTIRYVAGGRPNRPTSSGAEDVLAQRFARGEIDADEFRLRMTTLRENLPT